MDQLDDALRELSINDCDYNCDYEVASITSNASLSAAKVRQRRAENQSDAQRKVNLHLQREVAACRQKLRRIQRRKQRGKTKRRKMFPSQKKIIKPEKQKQKLFCSFVLLVFLKAPTIHEHILSKEILKNKNHK
jgi:hypothetical protein